MKERPMLFNGDMVRAILSGRKTQTRRPMKYIPGLGQPDEWCSMLKKDPADFFSIAGDYRRFCPFGVPGDRIWVRESMDSDGDDWWFPAAGRGEFEFPLDGAGNDYRSDVLLWMKKQRDAGRISVPSIHMPRWACRIVLEITDVRVQRVQEITNKEAYDEGIQAPQVPITEPDGFQHQAHGWEGIYSFRQLWNSIYGNTDFAWDKNPWVWALTFKRVEGETK